MIEKFRMESQSDLETFIARMGESLLPVAVWKKEPDSLLPLLGYAWLNGDYLMMSPNPTCLKNKERRQPTKVSLTDIQYAGIIYGLNKYK